MEFDVGISNTNFDSIMCYIVCSWRDIHSYYLEEEKMPEFIPTKLQEERDKDKSLTFTVWLNPQETEEFKQFKVKMEQPKDSTAMKMLAKIGMRTLDDPKTSYILDVLFKNKKNNKRMGIAEIE